MGPWLCSFDSNLLNCTECYNLWWGSDVYATITAWTETYVCYSTTNYDEVDRLMFTRSLDDFPISKFTVWAFNPVKRE